MVPTVVLGDPDVVVMMMMMVVTGQRGRRGRRRRHRGDAHGRESDRRSCPDCFEHWIHFLSMLLVGQVLKLDIACSMTGFMRPQRLGGAAATTTVEAFRPATRQATSR